ncbi:MAG TPA: hypothetical protein VFH62_08760 [Dehalococcoidia bacterium]|jgi:hypothetical protein|nr:hypothetical protein [Dehalococcoidia bacterium]
MRAYLDAGLILRHFSEPVPPEALRALPEAGRTFRVPWFTVMLWERAAG